MDQSQLPDDSVLFKYEERSFLWPAVGLIVLMIAGAVGAFFYFKYPDEIANGFYGPVYNQLGISRLPQAFERSPDVSRRLDQLRREPCDREAIRPLAKLMSDGGYPREAALSASGFSKRCGVDEGLDEIAYAALMRLGDYAGAVATASEMIKQNPARSRFRYLRGTAYESQTDYQAALSDYISALQLFTDLSRVVAAEYYRISKMYDALGRPCEAITPLEMYLSYDVRKRQTTQMSRLISEYAAKGQCAATYANGGDHIIIGDENIIDITINGARGRVIVDTGASMVSMTPSFAARARIVPDEKNPITFQIVGGTSQGAPGNAQMIQVGDASAANVPVSVTVGNDAAFGVNIDGLLGMTFLARFEVTLSNGALDLKPRALN